MFNKIKWKKGDSGAIGATFPMTASGVAMVEVIVAIVVAAITSMAIFSVILSAVISQRKADKREAAAMLIQKTAEKLKSYVTATTSLPSGFKTPESSWHLPGDSNTGWALTAGNHDVSSLLPDALKDESGKGSFSYTVTNENCLGLSGENEQCKKVVFSLEIPVESP
jgi:Tfp pilus assembly protein PilV